MCYCFYEKKSQCVHRFFYITYTGCDNRICPPTKQYRETKFNCDISKMSVPLDFFNNKKQRLYRVLKNGIFVIQCIKTDSSIPWDKCNCNCNVMLCSNVIVFNQGTWQARWKGSEDTETSWTV